MKTFMVICGVALVLQTVLVKTQDAILEHEKNPPPLVLKCNVSGIPDAVVSWERNGMPIEETPACKDDTNKCLVDTNNNTLTINSPNPYDVGEYQCVWQASGQNYSQTLNVYAKAYIDHHHLGKSRNLGQGSNLEVMCPATGHPLPTVDWLKAGKPLDYNDSRIALNEHDGVEGAKLTINNLENEDRAEYTCVAKNMINGTMYNDTAVIMVRVIDKLAALWPFLGICAEVAILCIIIFIYEKKRSKQNFDDDESVPNNDVKNNDHRAAKNDEVRQRK